MAKLFGKEFPLLLNTIMAGIALVSILVEIGYTDTEELSPHAHCKGVGGLVLELAMSVRQ